MDDRCPIWIRHGVVHDGATCAHPEQHPYYEFGTNFAGVVTQWVKQEQAERMPGDIFLAGPGLPHYSTGKKYPHHYATIFFLPSVLIGMGPIADGARILRRFTMRQGIATQLVRPPPKVRAALEHGFHEIIREFDHGGIGREMKLRAILVSMIVDLLRWEEKSGKSPVNAELAIDWKRLERALEFLHEQFQETVYAREVAAHAGISESRLKQLFHDTLGMPWSRYLQIYRIHRALDQLGACGKNVSETALSVGFESLSHFNSTFRSLMGVSPRDYASRVPRRADYKGHGDGALQPGC